MCSDRELSSSDDIDCLTISCRDLALLRRYDCWVLRRSSIDASFSSSTSNEIISFLRFLGLSTSFYSVPLSDRLSCISCGSASRLDLRLPPRILLGESLPLWSMAREPLRFWPVPRVF